MKITAAVLALVLLLAFGAHKQQESELTVRCGTVTGGGSGVVAGIQASRGFGEKVRDIIDNPEQYRATDAVKRSIDGVKSVILSWILPGYRTMRGEKIDPHILKMEQDHAQAVKDAAAACCPTTPPPLPQPEDDWTPDMASFQAGEFTTGQLRIAAQADRVRRQLGLPTRASVVILAAGFQESRVANLNYGDRDSIGWLQQRNAWAPRADRLDPAKAARIFFLGGKGGQRGLTDVRGWEQMPVTRAAWSVQVSAYPNGAAQFEDDARRLLAAATKDAPKATEPEAPGYTAGDCTPAGETSTTKAPSVQAAVAPAGWDFPAQRSVDQAIAWMRRHDNQNTGGWQARCLAAVGQAYGHPGTTQVNGRYWARDQWSAMPARYKTPGKGNPPRGALVFWDTGRYGHIAISNGDGRVWTTDPPGRTGQIGLVPLSSIDGWGTRLGHGAPYFIGKTGAQA